MYCQPAYRTSRPPASRPMVAPVAAMPPQMPSALFRSAPSANIFITMDSAAGSSTAAPRPWTPRMMIRKVSVVAAAQQEPAEGQRVGGHHPLQVRLGEVQLAADGGQRDVGDRQVDDRHEERDGEQREGPPAAHFAGYRGLLLADVPAVE